LPKDWAIVEVLVAGWRIGLTIHVAVAVASIVAVTVEVQFKEHENVAVVGVVKLSPCNKFCVCDASPNVDFSKSTMHCLNDYHI
jgi:hypothetical protein